jgi:hypothetical protein
MFVGHYAASLALKKFEKRASLGMLFLAVQLVDILFFPFVLLGIERINIIENYTESTHFQLEYMPYTHSLLASLLWAAAAYALFRWVITKDRRIALVMAIAVFSHWVIDLLVHTPDLPIWSDASMKLGLGLWNNAVVTYLEAALLLGATWLYLKSTTASTKTGKYGMGVFVVFMLLMNVGNVFGPLQTDSKVVMSVSALSAYFADECNNRRVNRPMRPSEAYNGEKKSRDTCHVPDLIFSSICLVCRVSTLATKAIQRFTYLTGSGHSRWFPPTSITYRAGTGFRK